MNLTIDVKIHAQKMSKYFFKYKNHEITPKEIVSSIFDVFVHLRIQINDDDKKALIIHTEDTIKIFLPNILHDDNHIDIISKSILHEYKDNLCEISSRSDIDGHKNFVTQSYPEVNIFEISIDTFLNRDFGDNNSLSIRSFSEKIILDKIQLQCNSISPHEKKIESPPPSLLLIDKRIYNGDDRDNILFPEIDDQFKSLVLNHHKIFEDFDFTDQEIESVMKYDIQTKFTNEHDDQNQNSRKFVASHFEETLFKCLRVKTSLHFFDDGKKNQLIWIFDSNCGIWKQNTAYKILRDLVTDWMPKYLREHISKLEIPNIEIFVNEMIKHTSQLNVINKLVNQLTRYSYTPNILNQLNEDADLIGFQDCVYDIKKNIFYIAPPEKYISMQTNIRCRDLMHSNYRNTVHSQIKELNALIHILFPNQNIRNFFYQYLGSLIEGGNSHKIFFIWWGLRNNGK